VFSYYALNINLAGHHRTYIAVDMHIA